MIEELEYYSRNETILSKKFNNNFIVINGTDVLGTYKSEREAYFEMLKSEKMGTFLIQYCSTKENCKYFTDPQIFIKSK